MRERSRIPLALWLVCVLGGLAWQVLKPREPVYNKGKSLTQWLAQRLLSDKQ